MQISLHVFRCHTRPSTVPVRQRHNMPRPTRRARLVSRPVYVVMSRRGAATDVATPRSWRRAGGTSRGAVGRSGSGGRGACGRGGRCNPGAAAWAGAETRLPGAGRRGRICHLPNPAGLVAAVRPVGQRGPRSSGCGSRQARQDLSTAKSGGTGAGGGPGREAGFQERRLRAGVRRDALSGAPVAAVVTGGWRECAGRRIPAFAGMTGSGMAG